MARISSGTYRKEKRSYTLSREALAVLEEVRKERKAASTSAVLEEILLRVKKERERQKVDEAVGRYYDSLSDKEVAEQSAWGELAARESEIKK